MSFNIATRLNNLQYQINQKAGNPLSADLDCNNFDITDADQVTCSQLNYTTLNPPVGGSAQNLQETLETGNSANYLSIIDVSAVVFSDSNMLNVDIIAMQNASQNGQLIIGRADDADPIFPQADLAIGTINTWNTTGTNNIRGTLNVGFGAANSLLTVDGSITIDRDGSDTQTVNLSVDSGTNLNINNNVILKDSLGNMKNISVDTLNYATLNPPVGGSPQDLDQTLTEGNDAGGQNIANVGAIYVASYQGVGTDGAFQIGDNALNSFTNDDGAGTPQLTLGFANINMGGNKIINLDSPVTDDEPATKGYTDTAIAAIKLPICYRYPMASGGIAAQTISSSSTYALFWQSPSYTGGQNYLVNIQCSNFGNGGSLYTNILESYILISEDGFTSYDPSDIVPWNSIPPAAGVFWSPAFNGWVNIPNTWATFYIRIAVRQSLLASYDFNGSDVLVTVYPQ